MYNNVYQHKTTRGFEKLIHAAWRRAKTIRESGVDAQLVREISEFLDAKPPDVRQYLAMEDATLVYQMLVWTRHPDKVLCDLAQRFLSRKRLSAIEDPVLETAFPDARDRWERALEKTVADAGFDAKYYALRDDLKLTIYNPYIPEKEEKEQDPYNAIVIQPDGGGKPREISTLLERLGPVTGAREKRYRYYVPRECRDKVMAIVTSKNW